MVHKYNVQNFHPVRSKRFHSTSRSLWYSRRNWLALAGRDFISVSSSRAKKVPTIRSASRYAECSWTPVHGIPDTFLRYLVHDEPVFSNRV